MQKRMGAGGISPGVSAILRQRGRMNGNILENESGTPKNVKNESGATDLRKRKKPQGLDSGRKKVYGIGVPGEAPHEAAAKPRREEGSKS